jgi:hypothetical protein
MIWRSIRPIDGRRSRHLIEDRAVGLARQSAAPMLDINLAIIDHRSAD